jgi:hypothetical protein
MKHTGSKNVVLWQKAALAAAIHADKKRAQQESLRS